jgi:hypothetical protein
MQFLVYLAVVFATVFGVMLEMDVLVEPVQKLEQTASIPMSPPPPMAQVSGPQAAGPQASRAEVPRAQTAATPAAAPQPNADKAAPPATPAETTAAAPADEAPADETPAPAPDKTADAAPANHCDLRACAQAYHSFRAEDCTYQPYQGPREPCAKGAALDAPASLNAHAEANTASGAHCDINACADAYTTFNPVDCTYQPSDGPRRICSK